MHVEGGLSLRMSTWNPAAGFVIPVARQTRCYETKLDQNRQSQTAATAKQVGPYFLSKSDRYSSYPLPFISSTGMKWKAAELTA